MRNLNFVRIVTLATFGSLPLVKRAQVFLAPSIMVLLAARHRNCITVLSWYGLIILVRVDKMAAYLSDLVALRVGNTAVNLRFLIDSLLLHLH